MYQNCHCKNPQKKSVKYHGYIFPILSDLFSENKTFHIRMESLSVCPSVCHLYDWPSGSRVSIKYNFKISWYNWFSVICFEIFCNTLSFSLLRGSCATVLLTFWSLNNERLALQFVMFIEIMITCRIHWNYTWLSFWANLISYRELT